LIVAFKLKFVLAGMFHAVKNIAIRCFLAGNAGVESPAGCSRIGTDFFNQRKGARSMKNMTVFSGVQMQWLAMLAGMFCLTVATGASAEPNARPCAEDAARLCQGVQQGEGRVARCLKEHANELSPACKKNIAEAKEEVREFAQACKADSDKLCKGIQPGGGRILQCLKQHEGELSPGCKEKMNHPQGRQR
jgi:Cysteine rich repeat